MMKHSYLSAPRIQKERLDNAYAGVPCSPTLQLHVDASTTNGRYTAFPLFQIHRIAARR